MVGNGQVRLMAVNEKGAFMDRLVDIGAQLIEQIQEIMRKKGQPGTITPNPSAEFVGTQDNW